jgi:protein-glutamine gamma-glutamyltransferase
MKQSAFFSAFAVGIWGYFLQTWLVAVILMSLILLSRILDWRWQLEQKQFYRVVDFCVVLIAVLLAYGYFGETDSNPVYLILKWSPALMAPILLAQIYSNHNEMPMSALFYAMRQYDQEGSRKIDFNGPYTLVSIMAAGAANLQSLEYFLVIVCFLVVFIWAQRPKHFRIRPWIAILTIAVGLSYFGQQGLKDLHNYAQEKSLEFLSDWSTNPFKAHTSIGEVGKLKLSDRIEFHVKANGPMLLHQTSYNIYGENIWQASAFTFKPFKNQSSQNSEPLKQLTIVQNFGTDSILALPDGTVSINGLDNASISRSGLGAFRISNAPSWSTYQINYTGKRESENNLNDLQVPDQHRVWLEPLSRQLNLPNLTPDQIAITVQSYFHRKFLYSLYNPDQNVADQALIDFMLERKAGHCEYFAVASVFLLRHSGIPARLVNGYSVQEYDPILEMYRVRRRHSHAWAIASIGNQWKVVDSTPAQWLEMEAGNAGLFQPITDYLSQMLFKFNRWQAKDDASGVKTAGGFVLFLLIGYISWYLYKLKRTDITLRSKNNRVSEIKQLAGRDSEFYLIEKYFQENASSPKSHENIFSWVRQFNDSNLDQIVMLHHRYRYDPNGISTEQRIALRTSVKKWLATR